jgi:hypothetical protein
LLPRLILTHPKADRKLQIGSVADRCPAFTHAGIDASTLRKPQQVAKLVFA